MPQVFFRKENEAEMPRIVLTSAKRTDNGLIITGTIETATSGATLNSLASR